ncbi:hypothetical protein H257_16818 [Aphanomyces astaci]|uniref:Uncharacterized protein n=1 Tax=Aphanomyces astaci TaxID=112090 RepID=W4FJ70_APHAT|nr:hypothetical protein H257_16818 [Aphanomyces astaci]ETV66889.1 hypothetical protein H257_16818 [Aphanomyces astaci]|eukprot:XP_009843692.1 hypothetical protein H257_16818 [Aphanomyces astaci]
MYPWRSSSLPRWWAIRNSAPHLNPLRLGNLPHFRRSVLAHVHAQRRSHCVDQAVHEIASRPKLRPPVAPRIRVPTRGPARRFSGNATPWTLTGRSCVRPEWLRSETAPDSSSSLPVAGLHGHVLRH